MVFEKDSKITTSIFMTWLSLGGDWSAGVIEICHKPSILQSTNRRV